jgi:hypothetical protein
MDVTRTLQKAVKEYQWGTASLAAAMGVSSDKVLLAKVDPNRRETHLSPEEVVQVQKITGDHGALFAMAEELGYLCLANPAANQVLGDCAEHLVDSVARCSDYFKTISAATSDGQIKLNELKEIDARCLEAMAALVALRAWAAKKHEDSKPAHLRIA